MEVPSLRGMLTKMVAGRLFNVVGAAMGKSSLVLLTMALTMSLNEAAGPYSVPPILSTISLETDLT